jgi:hypothetical protein
VLVQLVVDPEHAIDAPDTPSSAQSQVVPLSVVQPVVQPVVPLVVLVVLVVLVQQLVCASAPETSPLTILVNFPAKKKPETTIIKNKENNNFNGYKNLDFSSLFNKDDNIIGNMFLFRIKYYLIIART